MLAGLTSRIEQLYDLLFPPFCLGCGRTGGYVCHRCAVFLIEAEPVCPGCGYPSEGGVRHDRCVHALDGQILVWHGQGLAGRIKYELYQHQATHLLSDLLARALAVVVETGSHGFWRVWLDPSTEIIPFSGDGGVRQGTLAEFMVGRLISMTEKRTGEASGKAAILVCPTFHPEMENRAAKMKQDGYQKIWSLVLIGK